LLLGSGGNGVHWCFNPKFNGNQELSRPALLNYSILLYAIILNGQIAAVSSKKEPTIRKVGRPATGKTKEMTKVNLPLSVYDRVKKVASRHGESYSNFAARAIQLLLLECENSSK